MKILLDNPYPFLLAHGGFQIQIEQIKRNLETVGVEVEYLRWWDHQQRADIIHYFGRPSGDYVHLAHQRKIKVIVAPLLAGLGARSAPARTAQKFAIKGLKIILPKTMTTGFGWSSYRSADACIALTPWEARLMTDVFQAPPEKIHVVPNGVEPLFLENASGHRGEWLVCTATISPLKRVLELSYTALRAQTPVWIIGKAHSDSERYAQEFFSLARQNPKFIRYEGAIDDREKLARIYREARGFVLLSTMESLSLSALEAAASRCPLLLSDLPWAKSVFAEAASYCPITKDVEMTAKVLRKFYDFCPKLSVPPKPKTWLEVAQQLKGIYEVLLRTSV